MTDISTELFDSLTIAQEGEKVSLWKALKPFQIVSLFDMLEHHAKLFYYATRNLFNLQVRIFKAIQKRGGDSLPNKIEADATRDVVRRIKQEAEGLQFSRVLERLDEFNTDDDLLQPLAGSVFTLQYLHFQLDELHKEIQRALSPGQNKFMMIPTNDVKYYEQTELFGNLVYINFESTRDDVLEAGNCFATGRYTACVFHCMRVLEKGLHALTYDLRNKFNANVNLSKTVEETNWGTIIDQIQIALSKPERIAVMNPKPTPSDMNFYSKATREFDGFNDAWRKDVSHSRRSYDENEAKAVMEHVKAFMQQISNRLHE